MQGTEGIFVEATRNFSNKKKCVSTLTQTFGNDNLWLKYIQILKFNLVKTINAAMTAGNKNYFYVKHVH